MNVWPIGAAAAVPERLAARVSSGHAEPEVVFEYLPDAVLIVDPEWRVTFLNGGAEGMLGQPETALLGQELWSLLPPSARHVCETECRRAVAERRSHRFDVYFEEQKRWYEITLDARAPQQATGLPGFPISCHDVTTRKVIERAFHEGDKWLQLMLRQLPAILWTTDAGLHIMSTGGAGLQALGRQPNEGLGISVVEYFGAQEASVPIFQGHQRAMTGESVTFDATWRDHTYVVHLEPLRDADSTVTGTLALAVDITERKVLEEQLAYHAFHDPLTGLANRNVFRDQVARALERGVRGPEGVTVLFLDLDDFKTVNDSLGHATGDLLLTSVATRLQRATRGCDTVARLGGDEFAVLLEGMTAASNTAVVVQRIIASLKTPISINGHDVTISASIGIDHATAGDTADSLLRDADIAMYQAKRTAKGTAVLFEPAMHTAAVDRLELGAGIRRALDHDELYVLYQPIVDLTTGEPQSVEALLRWQHPQRGVILPTVFLPIAEETGAIIPLGRWVLEEACRLLVAWDRLPLPAQDIPTAVPPPSLSINVNLSGHQLAAPRLVEDIQAVLETTGASPGRLILEITESVLVHVTTEILAKLHALKALGIRLAIDDFGTGYSSLSYLQQLPVDVLKIDKSFVAEVAHGGNKAAVASTIISLGNTLGLRVVAEGVEHVAQREYLQALKCDSGQGYLFGRPLSAHELLSWRTSPSSFGAHQVTGAGAIS